MNDPKPAVTLDEIRDLVRHLPGPDLEAGTAVRLRDRQLTKPPGALGRLEDIAHWMAIWQGRHPPQLRHPRVAVFAGNHGVAAARPVSAFPVSVTAQMIANFQAGGAAVNQLCRIADSDLRVYEMDLDHPTADFTTGPAMDEDACARAIAYGMMTVEPGLHLVCLGEMGIGNTTSGAALCTALYGGSAVDWVGPGTGVDSAGLAAKAAAVTDAIAANRPALNDPLEVLRCLGGMELAAIVGAIIAARMARAPVLLDGFTCTAAAAVLHALDPRALEHCLVAHVSAEPGHRRLLERLGHRPLLDLGMRLGEASGAALAIPIIKAAVACHADMATFAEAGVSDKAD
ncbi:MAG: nicotinate-nucleotide--dimethylbenzimidazole phosphoribosyltransferase [Rhodospirillaceae bacterium]|nr:nicotinate-nucleotide--dimethylbenzimidazole phosphoribosyltransferase [Rhodospirillaceae bacterium]